LDLHVGEDDAVRQIDVAVGLVAPQRDADLAGLVSDPNVPHLALAAVVAVERPHRICLDDATADVDRLADLQVRDVRRLGDVLDVLVDALDGAAVADVEL